VEAAKNVKKSRPARFHPGAKRGGGALKTKQQKKRGNARPKVKGIEEEANPRKGQKSRKRLGVLKKKTM